MLLRLFISLVLYCTVLLLSAQNTSLNLKVYLEGPYNETSQMMETKLHDLGYLPGMIPKTFFATPVSSDDPYSSPDLKTSSTLDISLYSERSVDWILVSIIEESGQIGWKGTLLLESDGHVLTDQLNDLILNQEKRYMVGVSHRNHLPVQSTLLTIEDDQLTFDFTTSDISGLKDIDGIAVLRGGSLRTTFDYDQVIEMADVETWTNSIGQNSSYLLADIDMDGDVSVHDKSIILSNLDASITLK